MMKMKIMIVFLTMLLLSCGKNNDNIIASVNGEILTEAAMKANFSENSWKNLSKKDKNDFIQDWIQLTLLAQESDNLRLADTPQIKQKLDYAAKNVKSNALISQKLSNIEPSEDDIFNYYKIHKSEYSYSIQEYKVQRIFCTDKNKLKKIRAEITKKSFADAAKKYSEETAASNGGYIGWKSKENLDPISWNALKSLKKYHYKTIENENGFYIIRYYQERNQKIERSFAEVKEEITSIVIMNNKEDIFSNLIKELKSKAEITISK